MSNPAPNYHFVSKTASNFNVLVVLHLALAVFTSIFGADVSSAIAVMGVIAFVNASVPLLFLYLPFAAVTILVDIIRLAAFKPAHAYAFLVLLKVLEMGVKAAAVFFGYQVYSAASASGDATGGYEQINHGPPATVSQSFQAPDPFNPSAYTAPPAAPGTDTTPQA